MDSLAVVDQSVANAVREQKTGENEYGGERQAQYVDVGRRGSTRAIRQDGQARN